MLNSLIRGRREPFTESILHELRRSPAVELLHEAFPVLPDGFRADLQCRGYLLVTIAFRDQLQHLTLARRQDRELLGRRHAVRLEVALDETVCDRQPAARACMLSSGHVTVRWLPFPGWERSSSRPPR